MIALPGIVYLLINNYIPMFGIFPAFKIIVLEKVYSEVTGAVFRISSFVQDQRCLDYDQKHNFYIMWLSLLSERSLQLQLL